MTDKQIIIDGVDVSGCECIIEDYQRANNFEGRYEHIKNVCELGERGAEYYNLFCKDNPNCYYKQLKRKEQECESLKSAFSLDTKMLEQTEERESDLQTQLDQLKAENEKLKQALDKIEKTVHRLEYRTPLFEMKEIAKDIIAILDIINKAKDGE